MGAVTASAPGKIILAGEHAVVYGRPALAIPVQQVRADVTVAENPGGPVWIEAPDIGLSAALADLPADHPLALAVEGVRQAAGLERLLAMRISIHSTIPIAAGLGSGAAVSVALIRACAQYLGVALSNEQINDLAYRVEQRLHGTPSGIDNTVITYGLPVFFRRGQAFEMFTAACPLTFVIADTGIHSPTAETVGDVRKAWQAHPETYEKWFDEVAEIVFNARRAIESGDVAGLGAAMNQNQVVLRRIGVSCPELDRLVEAARDAGASGAKLSGGGRGGNMIALAGPEMAEQIAAGLSAAGAVRTLVTELKP